MQVMPGIPAVAAVRSLTWSEVPLFRFLGSLAGRSTMTEHGSAIFLETMTNNAGGFSFLCDDPNRDRSSSSYASFPSAHCPGRRSIRGGKDLLHLSPTRLL